METHQYACVGAPRSYFVFLPLHCILPSHPTKPLTGWPGGLSLRIFHLLGTFNNPFHSSAHSSGEAVLHKSWGSRFLSWLDRGERTRVWCQCITGTLLSQFQIAAQGSKKPCEKHGNLSCFITILPNFKALGPDEPMKSDIYIFIFILCSSCPCNWNKL